MPSAEARGPLLALDTSTTMASVGLYDGSLLAELTWPAGRRGSQTLLVEVEHLLRLAERRMDDLSGVAVALGPGSFSALRVGLSAAKGLAFALGCPLLGLPTLDAVAYPHRYAGVPVWAVIDAGRGRVVAAPYGSGAAGWGARAAPFHGLAADLAARIAAPAQVGGEVTPALAAALGERAGLTLLPPALGQRRAGPLAELAWARLVAGQHDDPAALEPLYLHTTSSETAPERHDPGSEGTGQRSV